MRTVRNYEHGFTLVELMVLVAIIGITAAVSVPVFASYRQKHQLNRAVNEYFTTLQLARLAAIKNRGNCTVSFTQTSYQVNCDTGPYRKIQDIKEYGRMIEFVKQDNSSGIPAKPITFNSRGTSNSAKLFITNTSREKVYKITTLLSGAIVKDIYQNGDWKRL